MRKIGIQNNCGHSVGPIDAGAILNSVFQNKI